MPHLNQLGINDRGKVERHCCNSEMDCAVLILSRPLYISVPIWEFCLSFPIGVTWKWSPENELGDFEIYNNLSQWRNVLPFCSSITCKNIGFMSRKSKKENQTELGALKNMN